MFPPVLTNKNRLISSLRRENVPKQVRKIRGVHATDCKAIISSAGNCFYPTANLGEHWKDFAPCSLWRQKRTNSYLIQKLEIYFRKHLHKLLPTNSETASLGMLATSCCIFSICLCRCSRSSLIRLSLAYPTDCNCEILKRVLFSEEL